MTREEIEEMFAEFEAERKDHADDCAIDWSVRQTGRDKERLRVWYLANRKSHIAAMTARNRENPEAHREANRRWYANKRRAA